MKGHEEWVDGSWSVDCVCGVDFDDGQEMVNCDECGVWVHTWCSRYVKGDDLFACHKCKTKTNHIATRMEDQIERGFKPIPMEERVHVQGVPGGDLALFQQQPFSSSISSPQLWKSTGYVPKKFTFKYKEFPCWDDDENAGVIGTQEDDTKALDDDNLTNGQRLSVRDKEMLEDRVTKRVKVADKDKEDEDFVGNAAQLRHL